MFRVCRIIFLLVAILCPAAFSGPSDFEVKSSIAQGDIEKIEKWLSKLRSPFEGLFSKIPRRARYRGQGKVQMQAFLEELIHNLKRWVVLEDQLNQVII